MKNRVYFSSWISRFILEDFYCFSVLESRRIGYIPWDKKIISVKLNRGYLTLFAFPFTHLDIKTPSSVEWYTTHSTSSTSMPLTPLTWNLRGELGDDRGPVALGCASAQGEGVRGARVEACEHVGGLVAQLHHLPTLVGEVQLRVKRAHCLVGDLGGKTNEYSDRGLWYSALRSPRLRRICIHSMKTFYVGGVQVAQQAEAFTGLAALRFYIPLMVVRDISIFLSFSPLHYSVKSKATKQFERSIM